MALAKSPYVFVQTQSAEELARRGYAEAFRFFLDAIENHRFYKQELVGWLKGNFKADLASNATDAAIVSFLHSRLTHQ